MIRRLWISNFRMLADVHVEMGPFNVLVGQNASGKSTFLGALQFVSDAVRDGVATAVSRALGVAGGSFYELCFDETRPIAFALDLELPVGGSMRYELEVTTGGERGLRVSHEQLYIVGGIPWHAMPPRHGLSHRSPRGWRKVLQKTAEGNDYFRDEKTDWNNTFRFGPDRTTLGSLPEDRQRFPASIAVRDYLRGGVHPVALDARSMRKPSPPGGTAQIQLDGSNLPYVVRDLAQRDPGLFDLWNRHLGMSLRGFQGAAVRERPEDKHLILSASFAGQHDQPVPSWLLSDGTLRLMALTLLSYASTAQSRGIYLIEEPENGLHPLAIQGVYDSLHSTAGDVQFLVATHSPIFLAQVALAEAMVFRRQEDGSATVLRGPEV